MSRSRLVASAGQAVVAEVRELIEQQYGDVWVEGRSPTTGQHLPGTSTSRSRTLTRSCQSCFSADRQRCSGSAGRRLHVLVRGRVSVYEQRGQMQLVAETMEPVGAGSLQLHSSS